MKTRSLNANVTYGFIYAVVWSALYAIISLTWPPMHSLESLHASEQNLVPVNPLDLGLGLFCMGVGLFIFFVSNYYLVIKREGSVPDIKRALITGVLNAVVALAVFIVIYLINIHIMQGVKASDFLKVSQGASYLRFGLLTLASFLIMTVINFAFNISFGGRKKA